MEKIDLQDIETRIDSFEFAPNFLKNLAVVLSHNGFFYGGFGTYIECIGCGMSLYTIYPGDHPLSDHQDYAATCYFNTFV